MAVVSTQEIWDGRGGSDDVKTRTWERVYRVITDDPADDAPTAMAAVPVSPGDAHPEDSLAFANSAQARQGATRLVWLVTISYTSEREYHPNPVNDPAVITWDGEPFQRPLIRDKNGKAVLNSAGDPFDPPIMRDDNRPVVNVSKNVASVPGYVLNYRDVTNSDTFTVDGIPVTPGKGKIKWIPVSEWKQRNGFYYRTLNIQIHLNPDGWTFRPLDQGYREKDPNDATKRRHIRDDEKKPVSQPVLLDGQGKKLANPSVQNAVFLNFDGFGAAPFSILPLA
jgi:hypothetical protein